MTTPMEEQQLAFEQGLEDYHSADEREDDGDADDELEEGQVPASANAIRFWSRADQEQGQNKPHRQHRNKRYFYNHMQHQQLQAFSGWGNNSNTNTEPGQQDDEPEETSYKPQTRVWLSKEEYIAKKREEDAANGVAPRVWLSKEDFIKKKRDEELQLKAAIVKASQPRFDNLFAKIVHAERELESKEKDAKKKKESSPARKIHHEVVPFIKPKVVSTKLTDFFGKKPTEQQK